MRASVVLLAVPLLLATGAAQAQGSYQGTVGTSWHEMDLNMQGCLGAAGDGMRDAGYVVDAIAPGEQTVFGGRNGTVIAVRCIPGRRIAVVFTHSPNREDTGPVERAIGARLTGRAPQPAAPPSRPGGGKS